MRPVKIVTDSTHYLPHDLAAARDIQQVSLYVGWGDQRQRERDLPSFGPFYERMIGAEELPTTSQPSIGDFTEVYEPLLAAGHDIVSIHMAGGISGTVGASAQAKALLDERGGPGRIEVIDGETAAGGLGMLALAGAHAASGGMAVGAVADHVRAARRELNIWFCIDTLEYLRRGGRVGAAQAWVGGALRIKPILSLEYEITPVERVRTAGRAFERMVRYLEQLHENGQDGWVVQHIRAADQAERLVERGRALFGSEPLFVSEVGPVLGTYTGPGMIGVGGLPRRLAAA
ncbi:MAG: DegV family protein [Solirubrobacteraceae bacterium]